MLALILLAVVVFAIASWFSPILGLTVLAILLLCFFPQLILIAAGILLIGFACFALVVLIHKILSALAKILESGNGRQKRWKKEYSRIRDAGRWVPDPNRPGSNMWTMREN